jgi:hypothetical protein
MILRILRRAHHGGWLALAGACVAQVACSNNNPPAPDAFVQATVGVGPQSPAAVCNYSGGAQDFLDIGTPTGGKPTTVQDGSSQNNTSVHVSCSITTAANGFDISLNATLEGLQGGSVTITSPSGQGAVTTSGGTVTASFQSAEHGLYKESDCQITFTYQGTTVPDNPPIAAGRIWGHISCPAAQAANGQGTVGPDGGGAAQCDAEADFLFEQCSGS